MRIRVLFGAGWPLAQVKCEVCLNSWARPAPRDLESPGTDSPSIHQTEAIEIIGERKSIENEFYIIDSLNDDLQRVRFSVCLGGLFFMSFSEGGEAILEEPQIVALPK